MVCRDVVSWNTMINGYALVGSIKEAKRLFDEMPERNVVYWNSMLAGYVKCGDVEGAHGIFYKMPRRDVVSWNAMLVCYAQSGKSNEFMELFNEMRDLGVKPTEATVVSLSSACGHLGALDQGASLHAYISEHKIGLTTIVGTALVDMKSGSFLRRFRLPENAKVDEVKASMENGVLTVTVPKEEVKKSEVKSVEISG
ncbi:hypothetical protein IFM89_032890 [Coptis chinensis]|uniref:SHSP domain-containing protein n=1 Tax=Coptis chinensis TaxID=261450 RepID=A0A835IRV2_9MAGN|nr:hypothetical protein IFM89_032890 [Coptis chinensis]